MSATPSAARPSSCATVRGWRGSWKTLSPITEQNGTFVGGPLFKSGPVPLPAFPALSPPAGTGPAVSLEPGQAKRWRPGPTARSSSVGGKAVAVGRGLPVRLARRRASIDGQRQQGGDADIDLCVSGDVIMRGAFVDPAGGTTSPAPEPRHRHGLGAGAVRRRDCRPAGQDRPRAVGDRVHRPVLRPRHRGRAEYAGGVPRLRLQRALARAVPTKAILAVSQGMVSIRGARATWWMSRCRWPARSAAVARRNRNRAAPEPTATVGPAPPSTVARQGAARSARRVRTAQHLRLRPCGSGRGAIFAPTWRCRTAAWTSARPARGRVPAWPGNLTIPAASTVVTGDLTLGGALARGRRRRSTGPSPSTRPSRKLEIPGRRRACSASSVTSFGTASSPTSSSDRGSRQALAAGGRRVVNLTLQQGATLTVTRDVGAGSPRGRGNLGPQARVTVRKGGRLLLYAHQIVETSTDAVIEQAGEALGTRPHRGARLRGDHALGDKTPSSVRASSTGCLSQRARPSRPPSSTWCGPTGRWWRASPRPIPTSQITLVSRYLACLGRSRAGHRHAASPARP